MERNKMDYRDILGFSKKQPKKKVEKKVAPKSTAPPVTKLLKEEFGPIDEGPAYEYAKITKDIEKKKEIFGMEVVKFVKLLKKKGLKDEGVEIAKLYNKYVTTFGLQFKKILRKLM